MKGIFTFLLLFSFTICFGQSSSADTVIVAGNCWGKPRVDITKVDLQKDLTGKVSGLNVSAQDSGVFSSKRIVARCYSNKREGDRQPTLFVDGVIKRLDTLGSINPNDIMTISILNSEQGVAQYGPDGVNGVILLYTKLNWLVVVDGILCDADTVRKIPASAIVSSDTVWGYKQSQVIGCRRPRNVLLISTRSSSARSVWVKDLTSGEAIAAATVRYAAINDDDTIALATDEKGVGFTDLLKKDAAYVRIISCVGYKTLQQDIVNKPGGMPAIVFLEKDVKQCSPVILSSIVCYRRITCGGMIRVIREKAVAEKTIVATDSFRFYPNPVRKGEAITMEWNELPASPVEYRVFTLNGALVERQAVPGKTASGMMRIINTDSRRAPGVYFLQLVCENGRVLASGKIILQ